MLSALVRRTVMVVLNVNGQDYQADVDLRTPLLWVLRDTLGLTGTKYGCGIAQCGACTVHIDGVATRSCRSRSARSAAKGHDDRGPRRQDGALHKVQQAWIDNDVPQCGYCQSGMIMAVGGSAEGQAEAERRRHRRRDHQYLPLRNLSAGARGDPRRRRRVREAAMTASPKLAAARFSPAPPRSAAGCRSASMSRSGAA